MEELEKLYAAGEMTNSEVAARHTRVYRGRTRADACAHFASITLIDGVPETLRWIRERGLLPVISTVTCRFAAEELQARYGFEASSGCELEEIGGIFTGEISSPFDAHDKAGFVADFAAARGLGPDSVIAVGDSQSDLPSFEIAGLSIALNPSDDARRAADEVVVTDDLRAIIPVLDSHLAN